MFFFLIHLCFASRHAKNVCLRSFLFSRANIVYARCEEVKRTGLLAKDAESASYDSVDAAAAVSAPKRMSSAGSGIGKMEVF